MSEAPPLVGSLKEFIPTLSDAEEAILDGYLTKQKAQTGSILVELGSDDRDLFFLSTGVCEVYQKFMLGRQLFALRVGVLKAPVMLGEANMLLGEKRNATIIISQDMLYKKLSYAAFEEIKEKHKELAIKMLEQFGVVASKRFLNWQQLMMDRFLEAAPQPVMGMKYLKKFMGNAHPCSPELAAKLFNIKQPALDMTKVDAPAKKIDPSAPAKPELSDDDVAPFHYKDFQA